MQRTAADLSWVAPNREERVHGRDSFVRYFRRTARENVHLRRRLLTWSLKERSGRADHRRGQVSSVCAVVTVPCSKSNQREQKRPLSAKDLATGLCDGSPTSRNMNALRSTKGEAPESKASW